MPNAIAPTAITPAAHKAINHSKRFAVVLTAFAGRFVLACTALPALRAG
jgi:hypothetical protein